MKLTAAIVRELPPPAGKSQELYFDAGLAGFGVRVTAGSKVYVCQARVNGRTRRVTVGRADLLTLDEARKHARATLGAMATGTDPNKAKAEERAKSITLADAAKLFLEGRDLKAATRDDYDAIVKRYFGDWQKRQLKAITPNDCVARFDRITRDNGPTTANYAGRVFRAIYNHARAATADDEGRYTLPENPAKRLSDLRRWHKPKRRQTYLPESLFPALREHLDALRADLNPNAHAFADYLELLLRCGLRKSEGQGILWRDVDMAGRTFTIRDTKNRTDHTLPMSRQVHALFERRLAVQVDKRVFPGGRKGSGFSAFQHWLEKSREPLRYHLQFHDLRRNFAILASDLNVEHYTLKRLLNHTTNGDVTSGYVIVTFEKMRQPVQSISDQIDRLMRAKSDKQQEAREPSRVPLEITQLIA